MLPGRHLQFLVSNNLRNKVNLFCTNVHVPNNSRIFSIPKPHVFFNTKFNISWSAVTLQNVSLKKTGIHDTISSINLKKRPVRKKKSLEDEVAQPGIYNVIAFATAEEYDIEKLINGLKQQDLYEPKTLENNNDVIHAIAKYPVDKEPREIFFFRDGMLIFLSFV